MLSSHGCPATRAPLPPASTTLFSDTSSLLGLFTSLWACTIAPFRSPSFPFRFPSPQHEYRCRRHPTLSCPCFSLLSVLFYPHHSFLPFDSSFALTYLVFFTSVALLSLDATPNPFHLRYFRAISISIVIFTLSVAFLPMSFLSSLLDLCRFHCPSQICGRIRSSPCSSLSFLFLPHESMIGTPTGRDSVSEIDGLMNSHQRSLICPKSKFDREHITT